MAILVNIGQRGFVLKEGFVGPTQQITVDQATAEKLAKMYPQELKVIVMDKVVKEPVKVEVGAPVVTPKVEHVETVEAPKVDPVKEPKKRTYKRKAK